MSSKKVSVFDAKYADSLYHDKPFAQAEIIQMRDCCGATSEKA
jgi:hypothetical protein